MERIDTRSHELNVSSPSINLAFENLEVENKMNKSSQGFDEVYRS